MAKLRTRLCTEGIPSGCENKTAQVCPGDKSRPGMVHSYEYGQNSWCGLLGLESTWRMERQVVDRSLKIILINMVSISGHWH